MGRTEASGRLKGQVVRNTRQASQARTSGDTYIAQQAPPSMVHTIDTTTHTLPRKTEVPIPQAVSDALTLAWAPATRWRYDVSVREFIRFCDDQRVDAEDRLPASEMLLAMFAASLIGQVAGATIGHKLSAVRAWHIQNNKPWNGSVLLQHVLKGATNATPGTAIQARRQPVTVGMLEELYTHLDLASHLDAAVFAVATIAFYSQLRVGEICTSKEEYTAFNKATSPSRKHLLPPHTPAGSRMLQLPWTKVKRTKGEEVAVCRQAGITDPIAALERHMQLNEIADDDTALASYCTLRGRRKLLTMSKFVKRCNEIWLAAGRQRHSAHCFRIGGTTHYLLQGVNPDVVRMMGRWSSDAFMRYWRQLDVVATVHTELLHGGHQSTAS
ncbi:hypothetical protein M378DRAFT_16142 [Amanita muscaria Koide BX008]|uniref:Tyr recombinase domain-containing protein n=1 Tax=Amanita muscaria (strain Koide BX008) TaxID=946122 RepID=A0A0C2S4L4_AMAMK|nr:hypothetical protein M378DRAFT_16142 [Amanita muscaria Koide BX008]